VPDPSSPAYAENCGRFTIAPGGGEKLEDPELGNFYRISLWVLDMNGDPIVGIPPHDIWLEHEDLATCPFPFAQPDYPTDTTGYTEFSGKVYSGIAGDASDGIDCDNAFLYVYVMGIILNDSNPVCVSTDSPDLNGDLAVSIADFAKFASDYNCTWNIDCDRCHDYDEDGDNDISDFALFGSYFNASLCP